ncbi:Glucose-1-phosphate adenylyltransferase [Caballeronia arationis]|nr:Glucose-1-phosphate adenylyltransferase [Caballeronia arationis]
MLTQYKSHSLLRHLQRGWSFLRGEMNELADLLPAQQRVGEEHWYRGTADAIYQVIWQLYVLRRRNREAHLPELVRNRHVIIATG